MQSPHKIGRARTNPLAAPARELPAGHPTVTEAQLRRLDHPGPLREHAATGNLAPARSLAGRRMRAPSAPSRPPLGGSAAPLERSARATHASDATAGAAARASRPRECAAAVAARPAAPAWRPAVASWTGTGGTRGGGAVAALKPAPARQTGRGESWATRVRALGGAEAAEKSSQVKSNDNPQTNCGLCGGRTQRATTNEARTHAAWLQL